MKPPPRTRATIPPGEHAHHDQQEADREGTWETLATFNNTEYTDENPSPVPNDEGLFAHAHSFIDTDQSGELVLEHTPKWSGGLRFTVTKDGTEVKWMMNTHQIETLITACERWEMGFATDWLQKHRGEQ